MAGLDIKVDDNVMMSLVSKAILDGLTTEKRDELIQGALKTLLVEPPTDRYGSKASPLRQIFEEQAQVIARKLIREELDKPPAPGNFRHMTETLIRETMEKCLETTTTGKDHDGDATTEDSPKDQLVKAFATAIMSAFRGY
jgi:hypothetical protein